MCLDVKVYSLIPKQLRDNVDNVIDCNDQKSFYVKINKKSNYNQATVDYRIIYSVATYKFVFNSPK